MAAVITIETIVNAPIDKVWQYWTAPDHIVKWNSASADWHTTHAQIDLRVGGKFTYRMEAKDGSMGFDFSGTYTEVQTNRAIAYSMDDGRHTTILFTKTPNGVKIVESFDAEEANPIAMQRSGWQAILDNFKTYVKG